jgi:2'-5' RNA ligase
MQSKRLFVGIPLSETISNALFSVKEGMPHTFLRWTNPENLHVTVCFIGNKLVEETELLYSSFESLQAHSFSMRIKEIVPVKRRNRVDMIWATFEQSREFTELSLQMHALLKVSIERPPLPHITMCRVKPYPKESFPALNQNSVTEKELTAGEVVLYESRSTGKGAAYIPLKRILLSESKIL